MNVLIRWIHQLIVSNTLASPHEQVEPSPWNQCGKNWHDMNTEQLFLLRWKVRRKHWSSLGDEDDHLCLKNNKILLTFFFEMQIASDTCTNENLTWYFLYIFGGVSSKGKPVREIFSVYKVFLLASRASHGFEGHYKLISISFKSLFMVWHYARTRGVYHLDGHKNKGRVSIGPSLHLQVSKQA
jgi:hypothetical protein